MATKKTTAKAETAAKATAKKAETKVAPKATAKKAETKVEAKAAPKAAETKAAAKTAPKTAKKAETKTAAKKTAAKKAEAKVEMYIQFNGATVSVADIESNVKKVVKDKKAYTVYVKPQESKAYIVADGETTGMDVFFVAD